MRWRIITNVILIALLLFSIFQLQVLQENVERMEQEIDALKQDQDSSPVRYTPVNFRERVVTMPVAAVRSDRRGVVGNMTLEVLPGNNNVLVETNPFLGTGLQYSLNKAVTVAKQRTNYSYSLDFVYSFDSGSRLLGGESAGAAATLAAIAAISNSTVKEGVVITGTVNSDGTIGRVGGVMEKTRAVGRAGYDLFLVPEGQATQTYYHTTVEEDVAYGVPFVSREVVPRRVDLRRVAEQRWGLTVREVESIEEARKYVLK